MKKLLPLFITLSLSGLSSLAHAENLLQVYQTAKESNPTLRKALADRNSAYENINQTKGSLLPQLGISGNYGAEHGYRESDDINAKKGTLSLQLTQTLFDMSQWNQLNISEKQAGISDITYRSQQQALILDTSVAYFGVLSALDALSFIEAQKAAIFRQLDETRQRFKVGLLPITDVQNAQAQYDLTLADEVNARNNLDNSLEYLRQVSGLFYSELNSLDTSRFKTSQPDNVGKLLKEAEDRNLDLLAARLSQDLFREQIRLAQSGHMPTLSLNASTGLNKNETYGSAASSPGNRIDGKHQIGVGLSLPIYSGGQTNSIVKQAQYNFISASELLESTNRNVTKTLRSSYNNIIAAISSISAYKQAVISAQSSLNATQAGYNVGTRTIVDVLNATTTLYSSKQQLSSARYNYLIGLLNLKSAIGSLDESDIQLLNSELGKPLPTNPEIKLVAP